MAIAWSDYAQGNDGNGLRVGIDVTRSGNTFTVKYYYQTEFGYSDDQVLNRTGNISGSIAFQNNGGGPTLINTATFIGSPGSTYSFGANITGSYNGANPSVSSTYTIPLSPPAAPGTPSIVRVSDTQHTVSWTRNATASAPYTSQRVQRRTFTSGAWSAWSTVAFVGGSATSYSDTSTSAQRVYTWRVQAVNSSGSAIGPASIDVRTTPAPPTGCTAVKNGSDIVITWANGPTYNTGWEVQLERSSGGAAFALLATKTAGTTSHTDVAPNSTQTQQYRVRTRTTLAANGLTSGYSTSAVVQLLTPPNAPTNLAPTTVRDPASNITLTWQHNPVDTTGQTQFQIRHRLSGAATWTEILAVTSATSSWTLPAGTYTAGTAIEWQVRTRGQHATFGPYSASAVIPTSSTPTVSIDSPTSGGVVATSSLLVTWGYFQAQNSRQASWRVELLNDASQLIEVKTGVGETAQALLATRLADGTSWTVRVQVVSDAGLTSAFDTHPFTVSYQLPPTPAISLDWQPDVARTEITVTVPAPSAIQVPATTVDVWRSVDGQATWQPVATGVPVTGTTPVEVTDWAPRVAGITAYHADAVSALPSRASSAVATVNPRDYPEFADSPRVWVSAGEGFSYVAWSGGNVTIDRADVIPRVLHRFAGSALPVEHSGVARDSTWTVSLDVLQRSDGTMILGSDPFAWRTLAKTPAPLLLRTRDDDEYAHVSIAFGPITSSAVPHHQIRRYSVTFTATEVRP